jgi:hypothetical protein
MNDPDWLEDPSGDDDESSPAGFNDTFESDCYDEWGEEDR